MATLIFLTAAACLFGGIPLFATLALLTLGCFLFLGDGLAGQMAGDMFNAVNKDILLAIPFFIIAGELMTAGGIARRLVAVARALTRRLPAGLAVSAVLACVFFAAISGSSPVTLIAVGSMLFPALTRENYRENFSIGLLSCGGTLGILIPPSIPMIVYAIVASGPGGTLSVTDLFMAGIVPGLFIAALLIVYSMLTQGKMRQASAGDSTLWKSLKEGSLALVLPVLILGGIYAGWFTATEAAAVAVVYAGFVEVVVYREISLRQLPDLFVRGAVAMGTLFPIIVVSISLNQFLSLEQVPQNAAAYLSRFIHDKFTFLLLVNLFLLGIGCVMDIISAILITAPLLAPLASAYGVHPVHFAIIFIVNLEIGYLTPPIGLNLFVAAGVFKKPLGQVIAACLPFIALMLLGLAVVTYVPALSLAFVR